MLKNSNLFRNNNILIVIIKHIQFKIYKNLYEYLYVQNKHTIIYIYIYIWYVNMFYLYPKGLKCSYMSNVIMSCTSKIFHKIF